MAGLRKRMIDWALVVWWQDSGVYFQPFSYRLRERPVIPFTGWSATKPNLASRNAVFVFPAALLEVLQQEPPFAPRAAATVCSWHGGS